MHRDFIISEPVNKSGIQFKEIRESLQSEYKLIIGTTLVFIAIAGAALLILKPRYEVKTYLDLPYSNEISELNIGRSEATGLPQYTPEQLYGYFTRRLLTEEAKQRFFRETFLPAQDKPPESAPAEQALYDHMIKRNLEIITPEGQPKKSRQLYSLQLSADSGEKAASWIKTFLDQVAQDARYAILEDEKKSIALQIQNTERDLQEKISTATLSRNDRQVQLDEALQVAQAVGIKDPQMTNVQAPRQDGVTPFIDGSRLYARGTKSLQAELNVLYKRKDDTPFVEGIRASQAQLNLLKERNPEKSNFKIYHVDGAISKPEKAVFPKKSLILGLGLFLGVMTGIFAALLRKGVLQRLIREFE